MVATERKRQGEIATAGCYSACYITLRNILILSVFFFLPALPLLIARKHFFISFPLLLHLPLFFAYGSEHIKNRSACHHGGQKSFDSPATFVTITRGEWGEARKKQKDEKFKPRATLIALHAADCKWQCRGCHLLLAASFNLMSSKMEFHFILGSDHIR